MTGQDAVDWTALFEFLASSMHRTNILAALDDGDATRRDLGDRLSIPAATLRYNLGELTDIGLVRRDGSRYALTAEGASALSAVRAFREHAEQLPALGDLVFDLRDELPRSALLALSQGRTTRARPDSPYAPVRELQGTLAGCGRFTAVVPTIDHVTSILASVDDDAGCARVVTRQVSVEGDTTPDELPGCEALDLRVHPVPIEFGLFIVDDEHVCCVQFDDCNRIDMVVSSDQRALVEWALDRTRSMLDTATDSPTTRSPSRR